MVTALSSSRTSRSRRPVGATSLRLRCERSHAPQGTGGATRLRMPCKAYRHRLQSVWKRVMCRVRPRAPPLRAAARAGRPRCRAGFRARSSGRWSGTGRALSLAVVVDGETARSSASQRPNGLAHAAGSRARRCIVAAEDAHERFAASSSSTVVAGPVSGQQHGVAEGEDAAIDPAHVLGETRPRWLGVAGDGVSVDRVAGGCYTSRPVRELGGVVAGQVDGLDLELAEPDDLAVVEVAVVEPSGCGRVPAPGGRPRAARRRPRRGPCAYA